MNITQVKTAASYLYKRAPVQSNIEDTIAEMTSKVVCNKVKVQSMNAAKHKRLAINETNTRDTF